MADDADFLQLECVRISAAGAAEMDGNRPLLSVHREEIVRLEVRHGSAAERPLIAALLGVILIGIAVVPIVLLLIAWTQRQHYPAQLLTAAVFAIPGWWLIDLSIRSRFFLAVTTRHETRKIVFHKTRDRRAIEDFVSAAKSRFHYV
jgi:hypothetical protein